VQAYDAKTHPLLWQHPTRKQALLELAARSHWPTLLHSLLPALQLSRLAASGTLSAVSMVGYKALMSMANHGRHELLSVLLQTGIISAQHALLLLESVLQKKGKLPATERVVAEILQYIGPAGSEATSVLKVAAASSSANVLAMLLDWSHHEKQLDLQIVCIALAEACESGNADAMRLLLGSWVGKCTALQAEPLLRAFAARGDAATVQKLLNQDGEGMQMVAMDGQQRVQLASCGLAHAAGTAAQRTKVLRMLLDAGAEPCGAYGELALRNAARDGQVEAMKLLLAVGTNVNAVDEEGKTTLCVAACSGCTAAVKCLLEHGAQVRMRCHDGREPLDFAVDAGVKQLLLAEVEKLRMGLLDELLAEENSDGVGAKGGKASKKAAKKAAKKGKIVHDATSNLPGADAAASFKSRDASSVASASPANKLLAAASTDVAIGGDADGGATVLSKAAKRKLKVKAKNGAAATDGVDDGSSTAGPFMEDAAATAIGLETRTAPSEKCTKSEGGNEGRGDAELDGPSQLREAAMHVLSGQADATMRLSSLISALYDRSAAYKELIKQRGGAKTWLSEQPDAFVVDFDCAPGHESVSLRTAVESNLRKDNELDAADSQHNSSGGPGGPGATKTPPALPKCAMSTPRNAHGRATSCGHNNGDEDDVGDNQGERDAGYEARGWVPRGLVARGGRVASGGSSAPRDDDDVAAAALLGFSSEEVISDPVLVERKIRAVQKKLRRVQGIEEQVASAGASGGTIDAGQQMLLSSKPRLQSSLFHLLQQWATLEPMLLEQQEQRLLAIADSECAVCLEEYSTQQPAIRTSCCGYHFHRQCLQQCLASKGHCPICSTEAAKAKVVEQRRQTVADTTPVDAGGSGGSGGITGASVYG
tara:strand:- start:138 stop:2777 length:2640 start_codon:yes stop_codon:yes gene_type:complete